jgi:O-antigen ligase
MRQRSPALALSTASPVLVAAAVAAVATFCVVVAYVASPTIAIALPVGVAVVGMIVVRPVYGIYAAILAAPLEYLTLAVGNFAGLSVSEALLLLTAAAVLAHALVERRAWQVPAAPHLAFGSLILVAATGLVFAPDPLVVAKTVLMWSTYLFLSFFVSSWGREQLRRLFTVVAVAAAAVGAMAIPNASNLQLVAGGETATNRATASFSHPNILAFFLVLALAPTLALALRTRGRERPVMFLCAALIVGGLMVTLSRGAIIGAAASLAIMLALPAFRKVAAGVLVVLVVAVLAGSGSLAHNRDVSIVRTRLGSIGAETQTNPRLRIYRAAPELIAAHPILGVGEANFSFESERFGLRDLDGSTFEHAHDVLLTVAAETGLVGLAAFVAFLWSMVRTILAALRRHWKGDLALPLAVTAALSGLFVNGLTDYPLRANLIIALLMFEVGAMIAYARR